MIKHMNASGHAKYVTSLSRYFMLFWSEIGRRVET